MTALPRTMLEYIAQRDHRLMACVNNWRAPRWVRVWMICATRGGDGWLWYAMTLAIVLFGGPERFVAVFSAFLASSVGVALFMFLKKRTNRRRPCSIATHCWSKLLPPDQFSFPSGHTITAFAFAVPFSLCYPDLLVGVLFCAISIAASRILLGMHFLSDVLAGALIGASLGYGSYFLYV